MLTAVARSHVSRLVVDRLRDEACQQRNIWNQSVLRSLHHRHRCHIYHQVAIKIIAACHAPHSTMQHTIYGAHSCGALQVAICSCHMDSTADGDRLAAAQLLYCRLKIDLSFVMLPRYFWHIGECTPSRRALPTASRTALLLSLTAEEHITTPGHGSTCIAPLLTQQDVTGTSLAGDLCSEALARYGTTGCAQQTSKANRGTCFELPRQQR